MSLKTEIQNAIVDPSQRLSDILRRAVMLAHRLKSEEFKTWVNKEINGYKAGDPLPEYRVLSAQSFGHFVGAFGKEIRNAPIHTVQFPDEVQVFANRQEFPNSIRELESMIERGETSLRLLWPQNLLIIIANMIYDQMVCMQAWKHVSTDQLVGVVDTVRNRLLNFVLEIEDIDPEAGEHRGGNPKIPPERVSQVFNNFILGSHNLVASGTQISQTAYQSVRTGDFHALSEALEQIGVPKEDVADLHTAIEEDGERKKDAGFGTRVKLWMVNVLNKIAIGTKDMATETAAILISNAISAYYGWN